jgi:predicted GIY-YIG superfamily endonuclease
MSKAKKAMKEPADIKEAADIKEKEASDIKEPPWVFYLILNKGRTYAGVSPDPVRRLRQHNGEIKGGAKYTTGVGPGWTHICLVHGFQNKIQALQFEWASKHVPPRDAGGLANRIKKLYVLLNKAQWTSKSPLASTVPLQVEWKMLAAEELAKEGPAGCPNYIQFVSVLNQPQLPQSS